MSKPIPTLILLAMSLLSISVQAQKSEELDPDIFAIVNGEEIKVDFIDSILGGNQVPPSQLEGIIERIITNIVVAQEAEKLNLDEDEDTKLQLKLTRYQILSQAYISKLFDDNPITEEDIKKRYEVIAEQQADEKEYDVYHILVTTEDEAKDLIAEIDEDFDKFQELAVEHSTDTVSGAIKGSLGWAQTTSFVPEFADAIKELGVGNFSTEPVQSQFGWHVIYVKDERDFDMPAYDHSQEEQIREALQNDLILGEIQKLTEAADVTFNSTNRDSDS